VYAFNYLQYNLICSRSEAVYVKPVTIGKDATPSGHHCESCHRILWPGSKLLLSGSLTYKRSWCPPLPLGPGQHGVVFCLFHKFRDGTKINRGLDFFVGEGQNNWRYVGTYSVQLWGEVSPSHVKRLPESVRERWVKGAIPSTWGRKWVAEANEVITEKARTLGVQPKMISHTEAGLREALEDGSLVLNFTILKCIGYRKAWYKTLCRHEKLLTSLASTSNTKKRPRRGERQNSKDGSKKSRIDSEDRGAVRMEDIDSDEIVEESDEEFAEPSEGEDMLVNERQIAPLPIRFSNRVRSRRTYDEYR
jgi:hypothetical protein